MVLSEFIQDYLYKNRLSQRSFARICGLSSGYMSMLIKNENPATGKPLVPSIQVLSAIANGMKITLDEMFETIDDVEVSLSEESASNLQKLTYGRLTNEEKQLIVAYRKHPEMQNAVNTLLGIEAEK